jgi:hypothetical protein
VRIADRQRKAKGKKRFTAENAEENQEGLATKATKITKKVGRPPRISPIALMGIQSVAIGVIRDLRVSSLV